MTRISQNDIRSGKRIEDVVMRPKGFYGCSYHRKQTRFCRETRGWFSASIS